LSEDCPAKPWRRRAGHKLKISIFAPFGSYAWHGLPGEAVRRRRAIFFKEVNFFDKERC